VVFKEHKSIRAQAHKSKYETVIDNLEQQGYVKTAAPDGIYSIIKQILTERPVVKKLNDRENIIKRLETIM
jgi:hypothetical protein